MVRPHVADLFERLYPGYRGEESVFQEHVHGALGRARWVLDAGCGSGDMCSHDLRAGQRVVVGVDVDDAIRKNGTLTHAVRGRLDALPLRDGSIDVVVCRYVLEHLEEPGRVFREWSRVLRTKGRVVLLTPNAYHYVTLISRLTPMWFHRWFNACYGISELETFPTRYRANTRARIARLARGGGFDVVRLELRESSPTYLEFSRLLYRVGMVYERIVSRFSVLAGLRVSIVATLEKTAPPRDEQRPTVVG